MSQKDSGFKRITNDLYETPCWVTEELLKVIPGWVNRVWEPAAGSEEKMAAVLRRYYPVIATDIINGCDFLKVRANEFECNAIITNPPYKLAQEFIEHALTLTMPVEGFVAMLLRSDYDHAKRRTHLFRDSPAFAGELVLLRRIIWFCEANGKPKASPSENHKWFFWDWRHRGLPTIHYGGHRPDDCET